MSAVTWKTKDGQVLKIKDMTDSHLLNAINFLRRKAPEMKQFQITLLERMLSFMDGEMAIYDIENKIDRLEETGELELLEYNSPYSTMLWHAKRRGLTC
jgi:hypothetical protein